MLTFGLFFIFSVLSEAHGGTEVMTSANGAAALLDNITGAVNGVQEEMEALKREMRTMTMLVNMVNQKSDSNAKNIEKNAKEVQVNTKNVQSNTNIIQTVSREAKSNSIRINSVSKEVKSVEGEVQEVKKTVRSEHYCELLPSNVCGKCRCKDDSNIENKYYCDCQQLEAKRDCKEFMDKGYRVSGVYKIHQNNLKIIQVYCDQDTDGGGWTVFQRRTDGSEKFYRNWNDYKVGFGQLHHEHWLGNTHLFTMTLQALYPSGSELRVDLQDWTGARRYAKYASFQIGSELTKFQMNIGGYTGNVGDSMVNEHNGMKFSTFDSDNDLNSGNCAIGNFGAWWYNNCHWSNLNGKYYDFAKFGATATGVIWDTWHGHDYSLKSVEMKMRRKN